MTDLPPSTTPPTPPAAVPYQSSPEMPYALWADRVIAALIDGGIVLGLSLLLYAIFFVIGLVFTGLAAAASNAEQGSPLGAVPCCICCGAPFLVAFTGLLFGLFNKVYLVAKRGCSIGQGFRKLRVVRADGSPVPIGTLIVRLLCQFIFGLIWIVQVLNLLWPLWDEKRQTLHDKAVGTFVIYSSPDHPALPPSRQPVDIKRI